MKLITWLFFTFTAILGIGQVSCVSLLPDSSFIWQEDRFFIHEYVLTNQSQENITLQIVDSFKFQSEVSVQYSVDDQLIAKNIQLSPGNNKFRVWVRYNYSLKSKEIPFELKNDSFSFIDTIQTFHVKPDKPFIHSQQTFQYIDYYSLDREKTELQLFDELWTLVGTYDAKNERIDLSYFSPATYYLKMNQEVFMIKLIDPDHLTLMDPQSYSTIDHRPSLVLDRSR
jgi:hypothetical protein